MNKAKILAEGISSIIWRQNPLRPLKLRVLKVLKAHSWSLKAHSWGLRDMFLKKYGPRQKHKLVENPTL